MNNRKLIFSMVSLGFLCCFLAASKVQSQCNNHSPGQDLISALILDSELGIPVRWGSANMTYRISATAYPWYYTDVRAAEAVWNSSSYQGTNTSFRLVYGGTTALSPHSYDSTNVVGFRNLGPDKVAEAKIWRSADGEIFEADVAINSLSWPNIQPHSTATPNQHCVRNALVHEFGHCLSLNDLYNLSYDDNTMYYGIRVGDHQKESLECDDRWGIWYLYDSGSVPPPAPPLLQVDHPRHEALPAVNFGAIPAETGLIGNFPNPFNPETWIAYQLSEATEVTIRIYDVGGRILRTMELGRRQAGSYTSRDSAVHWNGRTDTGEIVPSGVYFYSLITNRGAYTRKMVVTE